MQWYRQPQLHQPHQPGERYPLLFKKEMLVPRVANNHHLQCNNQQHMNLIAANFELMPAHKHKNGESAKQADFSNFKISAIGVDRGTINLIHPVPDQIANPDDQQNQTKPECIILSEAFNIQYENKECSNTRQAQNFGG